MKACFGKVGIRRLFYASVLFLLHVAGISGSPYQCLIPFQHCLGSFLPIGYSMQNVDVPAAIRHLNQQCPMLDSVEACTRQFRCGHDASRRRLQAFLWFYDWLCRNTHVLEEGRQCWEFPFDNDVITCGERHIAGEMGSHLHNANHPCPYIQGMVVCIRERMLRRPECSESVTELYINIIIQSSVIFSSCQP